MTELIKFTKMHGAGNDYIYVNTMAFPIENPEELAIKWSAPHTGIGSDGLVLIGTSQIADFSMRIFNADGSEAMMCGNASRCIGKYVYDKGLTNKKTITLETLSGIKELQLTTKVTGNLSSGPREEVTEVTVDMGQPFVGEVALEIEVGGVFYTGTIVSMGNPHFVIFVEDINKINLPVVGPQIEYHPLFPNRTNVEFVQVLSPDKIRMRVWERGSGITQACGTGACATAVAGVVCGKTERTTKVVMDGGPLTIRWDESSGKVYMTGGAVKVFEGELEV
ncbi:diaminopimelate epimerase [Parabacteroides sp. AM08-6]|uniref:diaminopimelate epimerase n=1 Tax=Parabacteroides sp. AM08-6 TaxID=2292053 RepID=UPI000EFEF640|nr:diaminopimelate epimerase [Parabacteroides sp. AM08-6]RHJ84440.1 diaminopimelate epimerase [Parabacteroides sp. AM08-6]